MIIETIIALIITFIVFILLLADMAKNHQNSSSGSFTGTCAIIAGLGGLIIYGFAYADVCDNIVLAMVRALIATLGMFLGKNEYSAISNVLFMKHLFNIIIFWIVHLMALYATTNAVLATIGARTLKYVKLWVGRRRKKFIIIYGVDGQTVSFGHELSSDADATIVYIDKQIGAEYISSISDSNFLSFTSKEAIQSKEEFLKSLGIKKGKIVEVYAISLDEAENYNYSINLLKSLRDMNFDSEDTSLTLFANMEMKYGETLQNDDEGYGFGTVMVMDRAYLVAHTLVNTYPPCDYVEFDTENAKAVSGEIFNAVIVGFGRIGQTVLKNLVINGQFEGCDFKVTVFDPKNPNGLGYLYNSSGPMMEKYDIDLRGMDSEQNEFYNFINANAEILDYVVVCTGNAELNADVTGKIQSTIKRRNGKAAVFQCSYNHVIYFDSEESDKGCLQITPVYSKKNLDIAYADERAMHLNHIYCRGNSALEDWSGTKFFDRMSCRASADFAPAFLRMVGTTRDEVLNNGKWDELTSVQLMNLAKTEHLRWCAFHYSMGYEKMPDEIFEKRAKQYLEEKEKQGYSKIKIQKDQEHYLHTCLVDWDELDTICERYRKVTGDENKSYKQDDANNVLMLSKIL